MKKRILSILCAGSLLALALAGCGGGSASYADGTYEGRSQVYEDEEDGDGNGYGVVSLTIRDGVIADCSFQTFQVDGTPKDGEYGKAGGAVANEDYYNKAQRAVKACDEYARQLTETGDPGKVDGISGATINYDEFQEAVRDALSQAKG